MVDTRAPLLLASAHPPPPPSLSLSVKTTEEWEIMAAVAPLDNTCFMFCFVLFLILESKESVVFFIFVLILPLFFEIRFSKSYWY